MNDGIEYPTLCVCVAALSDCSGLWVRPEFSETEVMKERNEEISSGDSGRGRGGASGLSEKAPPFRDEAPPSRNEDRESELQYYVSKVQHILTHSHR